MVLVASTRSHRVRSRCWELLLVMSDNPRAERREFDGLCGLHMQSKRAKQAKTCMKRLTHVRKALQAHAGVKFIHQLARDCRT